MQQPYKLPHTISNYKELITEHYFYVDKTPYLEKMEALPQKYLFFLRPRRFGKSLFTSLLRYYYGVEHKEEFQELFGPFYAGKKPTPLANTYLIFNIEFTKISTHSPDATYHGFLTRVKSATDEFLVRYKMYFSEQDRKTLQKIQFPADAMEWLINLMKEKAPKEKIYVLIDEYDHFANELIAFNLSDFKTSVGENGYVRKFYEALKEGAKEGMIGRLFATGITPITLDSMTSGFNIGKDLSTDLEFAELMGFSSDNVKELLKVASPKKNIAIYLPELKKWYNGYKFNEDVKKSLYNPSMVLYFATYLERYIKAPKIMLDKNIASDYHKIRRLLTVKDPEKNYQQLKIIIEEGFIEGELVTEFSFETYYNEDDFLSLLFYNGFLTIEKENLGIVGFKIPNYVIKQLYLSYFYDLLKEQEEIEIKTSNIRDAVREMALKGNPTTFFHYIETILKQLSDRDYQNFSEKYIKLLIMSTLMLTNTYYIESEREIPEGYLDLSLTQQPAVKINYEYLLELKYLRKDQEKTLKTCQKKAKEQLSNYMKSSTKFQNMTTLQAWSVVAVKDKLYLEQVK